MKKSRIIAICVVIASLGAIVVTSACSQQVEGEVCSIENGNDDCDTNNNLQCDPANSLNNVTSDRCCPIDRTKATHPACILPVAVTTSDAAAPLDTGLPSTPTTDAGTTDAGTTDAGTTDAADQ